MEPEAKTNEALPYKGVPESEPLLQGDIIVWHKPRNKWRNTHSLIINADCDLDKNNIPGFLTCVPVMEVETYLNGIWLKSKIRQEIEKKTDQLSGVVNAALKRQNDLHQGISKGALQEIIHSTDPEPYLENMTFKAKAQKKAAISDMEYIQKLTKLLTAKQSGSAKRNKYVTLLSEKNNKPAGKCENDLLDMFKSHVLDEGQRDVVWIPQMPSSAHVGFVAALRQIEIIKPDRVRLTKAEWLQKQDRGFRGGRLSSYLKYGVAERFASQFNRVGFAEEYEKERTLLLSQVCENLV